MKTLLALGTAALVLSSAAASAKTYSISLNGHCDVITLDVKKTLVAGSDDADCEAGFGGGLIGKVKNFGDAIVAGVQFSAKAGDQFVFEISWPLATGGSWNLYETSDGVTLTEVETGTYTVDSGGAYVAHGTTPVTAALHR
jgi:hypothetical protein